MSELNFSDSFTDKMSDIFDARPNDATTVSVDGKPSVGNSFQTVIPTTNYDIENEYVSDEQWENS